MSCPDAVIPVDPTSWMIAADMDRAVGFRSDVT